MADGFKPKPLVDANLVTPFGGIEDIETFKREGPARHDYSYVPGHSDRVVERELALAALHRGEIKAKEVPTLDWNCRWYRRSAKDGEPDNRRLVAARNEGYRPMTKEDIGKPWMTELPPGAHLSADGTIRNAGGDLQLFYAPKEVAARNAMRKKILTEEMVDGMDLSFTQTGDKVKGASPTVSKQIGTITK